MTHSTDKIRLRATFTVEYDANPEYYNESNPHQMAAIDLGTFNHDAGHLLAIRDLDHATSSIAVEPI